MNRSPNAISVGDDAVIEYHPLDVLSDPVTCKVTGVPSGRSHQYQLELPGGMRVTRLREGFTWPA